MKGDLSYRFGTQDRVGDTIMLQVLRKDADGVEVLCGHVERLPDTTWQQGVVRFRPQGTEKPFEQDFIGKAALLSELVSRRRLASPCEDCLHSSAYPKGSNRARAGRLQCAKRSVSVWRKVTCWRFVRRATDES